LNNNNKQTQRPTDNEGRKETENNQKA